MDNKSEIRAGFNAISLQYDEQRKKLIPCFDDFYGIAAGLAKTDEANPSILDIGSGTGLFASFMLARYPDAQLTLIDLSDKMLAIAKQRFSANNNVQYILGDYTHHLFEQQYDLIISSLSIHHLHDAEKKDLFDKIYHHLKSGGIFINADQALGETAFTERMYQREWHERVENSGLTRSELDAAYARTSFDRMATLTDQLQWLKSSGFEEADCVYKYFHFVIVYALKGEGGNQ